MESKKTRSSEDFKAFVNKIRIYDVLGQDDAGAWIAKNFPEILYIRNTKVYGWAPTDEWIKRIFKAVSLWVAIIQIENGQRKEIVQHFLCVCKWIKCARTD